MKVSWWALALGLRLNNLKSRPKHARHFVPMCLTWSKLKRVAQILYVPARSAQPEVMVPIEEKPQAR